MYAFRAPSDLIEPLMVWEFLQGGVGVVVLFQNSLQ